MRFFKHFGTVIATIATLVAFHSVPTLANTSNNSYQVASEIIDVEGDTLSEEDMYPNPTDEDTNDEKPKTENQNTPNQNDIEDDSYDPGEHNPHELDNSYLYYE